MSHYPGTWKYYKPAYDFDRWCLGELENSHSASFLDLTPEQLDEVGNTEMLPWALALGAVGEQHLELLSYQPTTHHGHAVVRFHPGAKAGARPPQPYTFQNHPYHFYNHPPIAAFKLNKLLYDSRFKPHMRMRLLNDAASVAAEYELNEAHTRALVRSLEFHHIDTDKPGQDADPLVEAGAHPIGALDGDSRTAAGPAPGAGAHGPSGHGVNDSLDKRKKGDHMNSKNADMLVKGLAVVVAEIAFGVNGPFLFERFGLYLPLAIATAVVLGAAVGYGVAALLLRASDRERAAAPVPAVRPKVHPKAA